MHPSDIADIVEKHKNKRGGMISILEEIQAKYGYLPEEALRIVSTKNGCSLVDIYGIATFYQAFNLKPRGKHIISVCMGTACHVRGSHAVLEEFERQLAISASETTKDNEFTLETVNCLGACAIGPIVAVDGVYFSNITTKMVKKIIKKILEGVDSVSIKTDERLFPIEVSCSHCNHNLMNKHHYIDGHPSIQITASFGDKHGWCRMSCLVGRYSIDYKYNIPLDTVINFFCPHCHAELVSTSYCNKCEAPMLSMIVREGGMLQICSRRGCRGYQLDL